MIELLDTNVLVRYLTDDPPELAERAETLLDSEKELWITSVVLVETAHVLKTIYGLAREEIIHLLIELLQKENIRVLHLDKTTVIAALNLCLPSGRVSISDAMIWAEAQQFTSSVIYTFDRRFPTLGVDVREPK